VRVAITFALIVALAPPLSATAIVAFRTPTRIVLASDSKSTVASDDAVRFPDGDCKIRRAGRWWLLAGGYAAGEHLDVRATLVNAVTPTTTLTDALAAVQTTYRHRVRDGLLNAAPLVKRLWPEAGRPALSVVVAGVDAGVLSVGYFGVSIERHAPLELSEGWGLCPGRLCKTGVLFFGSSVEDEPAVRLLKTTPRPAWLERADAAAARRVIELQIAATPQRVGRPVDVLEITNGDARWVNRERGSACEVL
jgi:hypothetical protein